jgi:deferrochelatase/peroxidase EfeB
MAAAERSQELSELDPANRTAGSLSLEAGRQTAHGLWSLMQRGLVYPAPFAVFATSWLLDERMTRMDLRQVLLDAREHIHAHLGSSNTTVVAGVGFALWKRWCAADGLPLPTGMRFAFPADEQGNHSAVFERSRGTCVDSHADLWFHIRSDVA